MYTSGIGALVPLLGTLRARKSTEELVRQSRELRRSLKVASGKATPFAGREWVSGKEGSRGVAVVLTEKGVMELYSHRSELLRSLDLSIRSPLDLALVSDGASLLLRNPREYDCLLSFDGAFIRNAFLNTLREK